MGKYISLQDDFSNFKVYEIINECFGKQYKGWFKAWYDVSDEYAAWFPIISRKSKRPTGTYGGTEEYTNVLSDDWCIITETNYGMSAVQMSQEDLTTKYATKKRLVFARIKGKRYFLGVFERHPDASHEYATYVYNRICDHIDLDEVMAGRES